MIQAIWFCRRFARAALGMLVGIFSSGLAEAATLRPDETIQLFPALGSFNPTNQAWEIDVHGWVYELESRASLLWALQKALGLNELTPENRELFQQRARAFLCDNEGRRSISIQLDHQVVPVGVSRANGHLFGRIMIPAASGTNLIHSLRTNAAPGPCEFQAALPPGDDRRFLGTLFLVPPTGLSVVSDVDDTIKISQVTNKHELMLNTFCRPFQPVPGMAAAFQPWATNAGAQFHYVSASPWQLARPLQEFLHSAGFPMGTFHLRTFRWNDRNIWNLFASPERHKTAEIESLLRRFPQRRFILVGDNGEQDPEIYGRLARRFPGQIVSIMIREVMGESPKNARYSAAFREVPRDLWQLFKDPKEIRVPLGSVQK